MAPKRRKKQHFQDTEFNFLDYKSLSLVHNEVAELFQKKFTLKSQEDEWTLPQYDCLYKQELFIVEELVSLKEELNATKSLLNDMDIDEWHRHTRYMHKGGLVVKHLRENASAEMCTQAWAKFQEILGTYDLIPGEALQSKQINSLHLCEAPGAFIACMNHHLKNNVPDIKWDWRGATLNPYYEGNDLNAMLDDDSFIFKTIKNWNFGQDGTGDLMSLQNLVFLKDDVECMGPVHLVTADGSVNCADEPGEQENTVAQLIFCESVVAMEILDDRCNYVFKMFTALECHMICLLYLLCCLFDEVHFIKPGTSKAGNSEVYVVCLGYSRSKLPSQYQEILDSFYRNTIPDTTLFPLDVLPSKFLERLIKCQHFFIDKQKQEIIDHINMSHGMTRHDKQILYHIRRQTVDQYVILFNIRPLAESDRMVQDCCLDGVQHSSKGDSNHNQHFSNRKKCGTYNNRNQNKWIDTLKQDYPPTIFTSISELCREKDGRTLFPLSYDDVNWLKGCNSSELKFSFLKGKKISKILNSRFCSSYYITKLNMAIENLSMAQLTTGIPRLKTTCDHCDYLSLISLDQLVNFTKGKSTSLLLGLQLPCRCISDYLQSKGIGLQGEEADLIVIPVLDNSSSEFCIGSSLELQSKTVLLESIISMINNLRPSGTFVFQIYSSVSRFTVGILYILHCMFEHIAIVKPMMACIWSCKRYVICSGFKGCKPTIMDALIKSCDILMTCDPGESLLEIVDIEHLYEQTFIDFVRNMNELVAHIQLLGIVNTASFDVEVIKDQNTALLKEVASHFNICLETRNKQVLS